jgi:hypothetical protein
MLRTFNDFFRNIFLCVIGDEFFGIFNEKRVFFLWPQKKRENFFGPEKQKVEKK